MPDQPTDESTKHPAAAGPAARPPRPSRKAEAEARAAAKLDAEQAAAKADGAVPAGSAERAALRQQWKEEAQAGTSAHDKKVRSFLLRLSLLNWGIAIVAWTISAFLGITSPASIIVYSVLFVIGLVAAILAILTYLLEKFGHEVKPMGAITGDEGGPEGDVPAAKGDSAAPAAT